VSVPITLGTLIDMMPTQPSTRAEIYKQAKCPVEPCRYCSTKFAYTWRLARQLGLILRVGRRFAIRGWDVVDAENIQAAQSS
jgi:hypothetical protein